MSPIIHKLYIGSMVLVVLLTTIYLAYIGVSYYNIPIEERFYHPQHDWFKPSGTMGHGLGIAGTLMMLFGVVIYIARKRYHFMSKYIRLKYLLEFHIFLCFLGPILILFHTAFKFGGIVSIAFWSMVAVVISGIIGRFIYIQIPRTIEGRELSINEIRVLRNKIMHSLEVNARLSRENYLEIKNIIGYRSNNSNIYSWISDYINNNRAQKRVIKILKRSNVPRSEIKIILQSIKKEISFGSKIERLQLMQRLFKYWHVAHLPFALIMLVIVVVHVIVTLALGYTWIF